MEVPDVTTDSIDDPLRRTLGGVWIPQRVNKERYDEAFIAEIKGLEIAAVDVYRALCNIATVTIVCSVLSNVDSEIVYAEIRVFIVQIPIDAGRPGHHSGHGLPSPVGEGLCGCRIDIDDPISRSLEILCLKAPLHTFVVDEAIVDGAHGVAGSSGRELVRGFACTTVVERGTSRAGVAARHAIEHDPIEVRAILAVLAADLILKIEQRPALGALRSKVVGGRVSMALK